MEQTPPFIGGDDKPRISYPGKSFSRAACNAEVYSTAALTIALGARAEQYYGKKDPRQVVTDEVAGYFLSVALLVEVHPLAAAISVRGGCGLDSIPRCKQRGFYERPGLWTLSPPCFSPLRHGASIARCSGSRDFIEKNAFSSRLRPRGSIYSIAQSLKRSKSMNPSEIRRIRKRWGMTQAELASELGVARETVSRWENGREVPLPSLARVLRLVARSGGV